MNFTKANELIKVAKSIAIVGHVRPDGDCIGSAIALCLYKNADMYFDGEVPAQFDYLEHYKDIKTKLDSDKMYDLLIVVDTNTVDRLGVFQALLNRAQKVLCFDHHLGFNIKCDVVISDAKQASCGEILYDFFVDQKIKITKSMADALYTSISTDTGRFLYPSTTSHTHTVAAALFSAGANTDYINYTNFRVFDMKLIAGLKQILRNIRFFNNKQIALSRLKGAHKYDEAERTKFKQYVSDIRGVRASVIISQESRNRFVVSLRSHGNVNVEVPARALGGGGHKNAAGFSIQGKYKKVVKRIIAEVEKVL
ncbi:MAG: bifunctional oligoribonuclease/PAP phosphatase NrnA [Christensenellaceae bacterium]|jgi:phosphoesterase RecJ-like protein|nr:bifunctional oligoribonuclease/PAP phosphatase NrnA [Christensenellaceae bacterium]